jgi:hypothetical protein
MALKNHCGVKVIGNRKRSGVQQVALKHSWRREILGSLRVEVKAKTQYKEKILSYKISCQLNFLTAVSEMYATGCMNLLHIKFSNRLC